jgi:hypothetical protein
LQADSPFAGRGKGRVPKSRQPVVTIEEKKNLFLTKASVESAIFDHFSPVRGSHSFSGDDGASEGGRVSQARGAQAAAAAG